MLKIGDAPILWGSKRQSVVPLLTCAAEYIALSDSTQHLVQAIAQLSQLQDNFPKTIYCDNPATVQVSIESQSNKRMRYLDHMFFLSTMLSGNTTSRLPGSRRRICKQTQ
ncbi:hypothetical protein O181_091898 [Austropuccinia psidii MF-1]|uniref:Integrase catalytic domain-containing protein n=1 Tax=Austropuccinia psidii MF-1 TaxID=1389203 RepID=A0A9Q3P7X0_9BASI|nr:hypothetical protein [Austropuccinia psidii MF-1]